MKIVLDNIKYLFLALCLCSCRDEEPPVSAIESVYNTTSFNLKITDLDTLENTTRTGINTGTSGTKCGFKLGDEIGLFVLDVDGNIVSKNIRLVIRNTEGNKAQSAKKLSVSPDDKFFSYYPYDISFDTCNSVLSIMSKMLPPAKDQSVEPAVDWLYTSLIEPDDEGNAVLSFMHKYCRIDIFNSYTNNHSADWLSYATFEDKDEKFGIEHYRYIFDSESPDSVNITGSYYIGNSYTGIRKFKYEVKALLLNGTHAVVNTNRVNENYAVDLGFPSGVKWAPFNVGAELNTPMTQDDIDKASKSMGNKYSWGELLPKYNYSNDYYFDPSYSVIYGDITGTEYDVAKQTWGGHWQMPNHNDYFELEKYCTVTKYEGSPYDFVIVKSELNGDSICFVVSGRTTSVYTSSIDKDRGFYHLGNSSSSKNSYYFYCMDSLKSSNIVKYAGLQVRPVLRPN